MGQEQETLINEILKSFQDLDYLFTNLSDLHQLSIPSDKLNSDYVTYSIYSGNSEIDLRDLVYGIASELSLQSGVPIIFDDKNLLASHAIVSIDIKLLSKALCHLIQNAIKYAEGGRITVQIRSMEADMNRAGDSSSYNRLNIPKDSTHSSPNLQSGRARDRSNEYEIIQIPFRNNLNSSGSTGTFHSEKQSTSTSSPKPLQTHNRGKSREITKDPADDRTVIQGGSLGLSSMKVYDSQSIEMLGSKNRTCHRKLSGPFEGQLPDGINVQGTLEIKKKRSSLLTRCLLYSCD
jgi:hypothetical protein